jgi:type I restriction enzyme S subunit
MEKLVPKLRFPEFKEEWVQNKLSDLYQLISGQHLNPDEYQTIAGNFNPYFTGPSDFTNDGNLISKWAKKEGKVAIEQDVLFTVKGNGVGSLMFLKLPKVTIGRQLMAVRGNKASSLLLYHYLQTKKDYYFSLASGNMIPGLSRDDILSTDLTFPSLPEQTKIAEFLTAIDKRIELLTAKKEKLTLYKKGVMQKIFNQEIRFKPDEGGEFPEWEEKALGDIGETINGLTGKSAKDFGSGRRYVQYKQIFDQPVLDITKCGYVEINEGEKQNTLQYGDILFTVSSETPNEIGMSSVYLSQDTDIYLNSFCFGLRIKKSANLIPLFSVHLFRDQKFRNSIIQLAQGSTRFNMSKKQFLLLKILLPSQKEQVVISNFLNRLDNQIHNIGRQIILNQNYKKGLLQQMFV